MAKILLTSIGRGKDKNKNPESYGNASYAADGKTFQSNYVAEAMKAFYGIDEVIFLGTTGSDWASLYEYLFMKDDCLLKKPTAELDDAYHDQLMELLNSGKEGAASEKKHHEMDPGETEKLLFPLRDAMDGCRGILLLHYGVNREEQEKNLLVLQRIEEMLKNGDELYIDMTHSFRSLQLFELVALSYLRKISAKKLRIMKISYALFEAKNEFDGQSPIVDLTGLTDLLELINSADEYKRFGTAHGLEGKLEELGKNEKMLIDMMGEGISINNVAGFEKVVRSCRNIVAGMDRRAEKPLEFLTRTIYQDVADTFYQDINDETLTQLNLALWHQEKKRYLVALTTAEEAMITWALERVGEGNKKFTSDSEEHRARQLASNALCSAGVPGDSPVADIRKAFDALRAFRNRFAHPGNAFKVKEATEKTKKHILRIRECYIGYTKASAADRNKYDEALRKAYLAN